MVLPGVEPDAALAIDDIVEVSVTVPETACEVVEADDGVVIRLDDANDETSGVQDEVKRALVVLVTVSVLTAANELTVA